MYCVFPGLMLSFLSMFSLKDPRSVIELVVSYVSLFRCRRCSSAEQNFRGCCCRFAHSLSCCFFCLVPSSVNYTFQFYVLFCILFYHVSIGRKSKVRLRLCIVESFLGLPFLVHTIIVLVPSIVGVLLLLSLFDVFYWPGDPHLVGDPVGVLC